MGKSNPMKRGAYDQNNPFAPRFSEKQHI